MAVTRRILSIAKLDDYIPQAILCIQCATEIDLTTAHYGRIIAGWQEAKRYNVLLSLHNGEVHRIPTVTESYFPTKITGYACHACYTELYNTVWRDTKGHLRRAFETVPLPVEQPKNDFHDASPITKGLYAPHAGKGDRGYLSDDQAAKADHHGKLAGFNREKRDDLNLKQKRVVVRNGRWKEDPEKYGYVSPKSKKDTPK
jgi:hypothetical protein